MALHRGQRSQLVDDREPAERSIAALAEKFINAIDSVLTDLCYAAGNDPKGRDAPTSIREAVARFEEQAPNPQADHTGRVANWLDTQVREYARKITLAVTEAEGAQPSLSIADIGEGQTPDSIPDTFVSLNKRSKVDIPFVQGKFNMGGTVATSRPLVPAAAEVPIGEIAMNGYADSRAPGSASSTKTGMWRSVLDRYSP